METTRESAIKRVVLGRVVEVIELLVVEEVLGRRPLDLLRAMLVDSHGFQVGAGRHCLEEVYFGARSHQL